MGSLRIPVDPLLVGDMLVPLGLIGEILEKDAAAGFDGLDLPRFPFMAANEEAIVFCTVFFSLLDISLS